MTMLTDDVVLFQQGVSDVRFTLVILWSGSLKFDSTLWLSCQEKRGGRIVCKWRVRFPLASTRYFEDSAGTLGRWLTWQGASLKRAEWASGRSETLVPGMPAAAKALLNGQAGFAKYSFEPSWLQGGTYRYSFIAGGGIESLETIYNGGPVVSDASQPYRNEPYPLSNEERQAMGLRTPPQSGQLWVNAAAPNSWTKSVSKALRRTG